MDKSRSPSLGGLIITVVIVIVTLTYLFVALNTQDALWFVSSFTERPVQIVVNCYGEQLFIRPEDTRYENVVNKVNETLSDNKNWDSLTLSEETYGEYQDSAEMMVMELYYAPRIRIHSFYKYFSDLDSIVIPLDGRHAQSNAIFGRTNNVSTAGSLHYNRIPDIRTFFEEQDICKSP